MKNKKHLSWRPNTCYDVGDLVFHRGAVRKVIVAGTSGPHEYVNGTAIFEGAGTTPISSWSLKQMLEGS